MVLCMFCLLKIYVKINFFFLMESLSSEQHLNGALIPPEVWYICTPPAGLGLGHSPDQGGVLSCLPAPLFLLFLLSSLPCLLSV